MKINWKKEKKWKSRELFNRFTIRLIKLQTNKIKWQTRKSFTRSSPRSAVASSCSIKTSSSMLCTFTSSFSFSYFPSSFLWWVMRSLPVLWSRARNSSNLLFSRRRRRNWICWTKWTRYMCVHAVERECN